jgi:hypothetical protein
MHVGREVDISGVQRYSPTARLSTALCSRQDTQELRICCEHCDFMPSSDAVSELPEIHEDISWNSYVGSGFVRRIRQISEEMDVW